MDNLTFEDIKPFLTERGQLEVELAAHRATVARLNDMVIRLAQENEALRPEGTAGPTE